MQFDPVCIFLKTINQITKLQSPTLIVHKPAGSHHFTSRAEGMVLDNKETFDMEIKN